jgi:ABC-type polysaccharide/polyol phosphate export permease
VPTLTATRPSSGRDKGGVWHYRSLILTFARRDLRTRFKGTLFGLAWSLLTPIATLATYSIVFGLIMKAEAPPMGNGHKGLFPVFLFSGLVPWGMYAITLSTAIASLLGNGPLMKKIFFPVYASVFGSVLSTFYQSLIELGLLIVCLLVFANIGPTWLGVLVWAALFGVFVAAVSLMVSIANVYLRDTAYLVGIALQLQFYLTPIIYNSDRVPGEWYGIPLRTVFELQPMAAFIGVFRSLTYGLELGDGRAWLAMVGWTAVACGAAWVLYQRRGLDLSEEM